MDGNAIRNRLGSHGTFGVMARPQHTVRSILALAGSYKPGTIIKAERVVDAYLDDFQGYRARRAAADALLDELASPERHARNRGGLFELIELHLKRRHREMARLYQ